MTSVTKTSAVPTARTCLTLPTCERAFAVGEVTGSRSVSVSIVGASVGEMQTLLRAAETERIY
eukprot:scaffold12861_cov134-Isochrysis_galbana.AAC.2